MRNKTVDQEYLDFSMKSTLKVVQEYRAKYDGIGLTLEVNPKILDIAHGDISRVLSTVGVWQRGLHLGTNTAVNNCNVCRERRAIAIQLFW